MNPNSNILVVDDSQPMRSLHKISLTNIGYKNIIEAENGFDAIDKLGEFKIDLILMDWTMPKMDGFECLQKIKKHETYTAIPVIMVTTLSDSHRIIEAIQAGAASYILKPVNDDEMKEKINSAIQGN